MTDVLEKKSRRGGGRAARVAARAAALPEDMRPIRAGMEGGTLKVLSEAQVAQIHEAALKALETIGLADAPQSGIDLMVGVGAIFGTDGRLRFPRQVVEDALGKAARNITLMGRDPVHDMELSGTKVHYGTAGAAVHVVDSATNSYRESTAQDLHDAARIMQALDNVHFFQRPMVCRDVLDNLEMDMNSIYASVSGTTKHIGMSFSDPTHVAPCMDLIHMLAGGEEAWRARPFISNSNCFVVPPMKFATESCETMENCIRAGMPVLLLSAGMSGATAPSTIAGAVMQATAECLAGLVYVNALSPGYPAIFGTWPFGLDLRTGAMCLGSGEQALLSSACAQMHQFYGLPGGAAGGASDSKMPDMQAGWEQMCSNVMAGLSGLNLVYEAAGMHASLLGFCLDSLVLADDLIGQAMRCVRGIEVNEETLALDQMAEVCLGGNGHYLGTDKTLALMQRDFVYPTLGNRMSPKEWDENQKPDLIVNARARKEKILAEGRCLVTPDLDRRVREKYAMYFES
ncbi:trimethylamine methyltransferase family protein [Rhodobacteraceae bacterium N5(2021)]|uniref:Methyltransferase n=1 Tax=Gymnodinialimonas phycosphaerae TaxID=2841589 RepID=A0A975TWV1_9RHOB|nr:trimethylamine methyltransferase family protein [Gymnodinialimonas phycosphaerae]MBY4891423.1 trimethylamine methyltransferase family protein [Gymnodinialimonas phycosphaerae]